MSKRSSEKRITRQATIIRYMRQSRGQSLNHVGRLTGLSDTAISHMEQGRMGISDARLGTLLEVYGYSVDEFRAFIEGKEIPVSYLDECTAILRTLDETRLRAVHAILVPLAAGPASGSGRRG